ncbi:hypothetical protein LS71_007590 [Helicobacter jaachi]|uniref:Outer membrane protein beta-barrel domain-containing protein n=1 Tax=Helicobacter jaachi TaxID=1677920 RepID=A0A4U8T8Q1_9HELI|nr:hypothetical protein [Helicobacter jaachi]TLD96096.1 hypothetical protein LS71_007590 [Helicobacter jaachi]
MKKYLLSLLCAATLGANAYAVGLMGFEVSPEIGLAAGQTKASTNANDVTFTDYGAFGRIWLGALDFVVAPQVKYDFNRHSASDTTFKNLQYGLSAGFNIGLIIARLTPYVGVNYSSFDKSFKDTTSYNAGLKLKFDLIPISLGLLYTYQNPEFKVVDEKQKMQSIQALIGLHF